MVSGHCDKQVGAVGVADVDALEILNDVEGVSIVKFRDVDVVRHPMVARIVRAYEAEGAAKTIATHTDA